MPQPCSSRRLVLTLDRATLSVAAISSAWSGRGERNSKAWTCATVRLMPQRVPISPQWRMNFCATGVRAGILYSLISVKTEYTDIYVACQGLFTRSRSLAEPAHSRGLAGILSTSCGKGRQGPDRRCAEIKPATLPWTPTQELRYGLSFPSLRGWKCPYGSRRRKARGGARGRC